jgi:acid stress-induced BolA-like protein IbaG/YrbA
MPLPVDEIKKLIIESIPDASIEIKDLKGDSNHYAAIIKSSKFNNLSKIATQTSIQIFKRENGE